MATKILLANNDITKFSIIGGSVDIDRYLPSIRNCQLTRIRPLLGNDLYTKICDDFQAGTLAGLYLELYDDYVKDLVVNGSAALFIESGAYQVTNDGITKMKTETSETISKTECDYLVNAYEKLYQSFEVQYQKWININGSNIPEYVTTPQENSSKKVINIGGWVLRSDNNCNNLDFNG